LSNGVGQQHLDSQFALNDFGLKKQRALLTLRQVDETRSGIVKAGVFMNLLNCMDIVIDEVALNEIEKVCCFNRGKLMLIKFENALKMIKYDNATESWVLAHEPKGNNLSRNRSMANKHRQYNSIDVNANDTTSVASRLTAENLSRMFNRIPNRFESIDDAALTRPEMKTELSRAEFNRKSIATKTVMTRARDNNSKQL
jgi:hypothetical protein